MVATTSANSCRRVFTASAPMPDAAANTRHRVSRLPLARSEGKWQGAGRNRRRERPLHQRPPSSLLYVKLAAFGHLGGLLYARLHYCSCHCPYKVDGCIKDRHLHQRPPGFRCAGVLAAFGDRLAPFGLPRCRRPSLPAADIPPAERASTAHPCQTLPFSL